jgi:hypothetical protein
MERVLPGGDHHALLGFDKNHDAIADFFDTSTVRSGIRLRSGGRAATFPVNNEFRVDDEGFVHADWLDVKGVGTHIHAAYRENVRNTGLLNLADALREFAVQRLIQRLCDKEREEEGEGKEGEGERGGWETVRFYGLIDTGLKYASGQVNPATGWQDEKAVLAIRQRQSRAFINYFGYNFSGNLLMSGEDFPSQCMLRGPPRSVRKMLTKYGISCEVQPTSLFYQKEEKCSDAALDDISGMWNLQADASLTHLMDFSDFYVFPHSPLESWRMSERAFRDAVTLEKKGFHEKVFASPHLMRELFGTEDVNLARERHASHLQELSRDKKIADAAAEVRHTDSGVTIAPGPPKYCMCWFMELDDSEMSRWALSGGNGEVGRDILQRIERMLPK